MSNYNFARMTDYHEMQDAVKDLLTRGAALEPAWDVYSVAPPLTWKDAIKNNFKTVGQYRLTTRRRNDPNREGGVSALPSFPFMRGKTDETRASNRTIPACGR